MPDYSPYELLDETGRDHAVPGLVLVCDHATNIVPPGIAALGVQAEDMARHIAWDVGAAGVTRGLAESLGATAVLSQFSRLVIDPNRGIDVTFQNLA
ncbi:MAG: N-formylglutamate amidohydrolase, partial [Pseudomonadota bacterium]